MKKFINEIDRVEEQLLNGLVKAAPNYVKKLGIGNVLVRCHKKEGKVALISGGGSGHEPFAAGYIGAGMLDGAIPGAIYTSPAADQIYEGIKAVSAGKGVLMIIMNYTGDIMNFDMAAEMAAMEGIEVEKVVTNDDVAVNNSLYTTGRRGVAGTVLVLKIAGALAETGAELNKVKAVAEKVVANVRTMGVAINPSTIPASGKPGFVLNEDEMEVGIGIHGEPGIYKAKLGTANEIADCLLEKILSELDYSGSEVAVLINGCGGTPLMELYIVNDHVQDVLAAKEIRVYKTLVGNYMTSIEQEGFSITLLKLDEQTKKLLDASADTPAYQAR